MESGSGADMEINSMVFTHEEWDLGVIIDDKLKFEAHIQTKINKANQIMGIIRRTFKHLDCKMFVTLLKTMVRPHIEICPVCEEPLEKERHKIYRKCPA